MNRLFIVIAILVGILFGVLASAAAAQDKFETDIIKTSAGNLEITFIGHVTLMFTFGGKVIHVDPWTRMADYTKMPKADIILLSHEHRDHLDLKALGILRTEETKLVLTRSCAAQVEGGIVMNNGDVKSISGLKIEAPACIQHRS